MLCQAPQTLSCLFEQFKLMHVHIYMFVHLRQNEDKRLNCNF